ncbi:MAG: response regulator, partial [Pseudomonadales bacterium]|nr:response regulator [Pseudomonadales bacterium]
MLVMIVDDSTAMRLIVKKTLRGAGFEDLEFVEASDGAQAFEVIQKSVPDLILCDW